MVVLFFGFQTRAQNIHGNVPTYKCKVFTYDTVSQKITYKRDYAYWVYDTNMVVLKKGFGKITDVNALKKQLYYLFVKGVTIQGNPSEAEVKKYAYIIKR